MRRRGRIEVLGVRHHGPGSARSVQAALDALSPTEVLVEGPPELTALVRFAADPALVPPVAALVYVPDQPHRAMFYPLAAFSPEWVALRWAQHHDIPVSFTDLPAVHQLAVERRAANGRDPVAVLASTAGYDDAERWWEDAVEQRHPGEPLARFTLLRRALGEVRRSGGGDDDPLLARREAAMRQALRRASSRPDARVAFVCGAYHAPAVHPDSWPTAKADAGLLRGLPRVKVVATWAPWTTARLSLSTGYGAGVSSPGWYHHLFTTDPDQVVTRWMVAVARLLRDERYGASAAGAVEAARLAEALAVLRGRPLAGLAEVTDAARAVLANGADLPLALIHDRLVVGRALGSVPDDTPQVPLARDLQAQQKRLRLVPSAEPQTVVLDLRQERHRARSVLLHRLLLLGVVWGRPADVGRTSGTFKEGWLLDWQAELDVDLIAASVHGTTVAAAATSKVQAEAEATSDLAELAALVDGCLLAELVDVLGPVLRVLERHSADQHDAQVLMAAIGPLARTARYGDVRGIDTGAVEAVVRVLVTRAALGLGPAASAVGDDAAADLQHAIARTSDAVALLGDVELRVLWLDALAGVAQQGGVHGLVQGQVVRLLLDAGRLGRDEARGHLGRALSPGGDVARGAAWMEGFLTGDSVLLLHDPSLLGLVDDWVASVGEEAFDDLVPLLRRTFARFSPPERRSIGEQLRRGPVVVAGGDGDDIDRERAAPAVATVARLLGLPS